MRRRFAALALGLCCLAATASVSAGPPGRWTQLSTDTGVANFAEPALGRSADGSLHVLWVEDDGEGAEDLYQARVSTDGTVTLTGDPVLTDWASMWGGGGDIVGTPDGTLRYFFGGVRVPTTGQPNNNLSMLSSDVAGTTWTLTPGDIVNARDSNANASTIGAGISNDGTPFQSWGATVHRGIDPAVPPVNVHQSLNWGCCSYSSDVATNALTGQMYLGWETLAEETLPDGTRARRYGVWVHELDPVTGQPIGEVMQMPGVNRTPEGSVTSYVQNDTRVPMTGRPGFDGVWVAHTGGFPQPFTMLVWRIGDEDEHPWQNEGRRTLANPAITSDENGRLWIGYSTEGRLYFMRSDTDAGDAFFGAPAVVRLPRGTTTVYDLKISAQENLLDVVAVLDTDTGAPAIWHTQVYPGLQVIPTPNAFRGRERISFRVRDARDPVVGAVVRVAGQSGTTGAEGRVTIQLGPYERQRFLPVTATKDGYSIGRTRVLARPAP